MCRSEKKRCRLSDNDGMTAGLILHFREKGDSMQAKPYSVIRHTRGFTLIEVMITVVIISILASVALPAYTDYVTRGKIPEATNGLAGMRIQLEQYYQDNRTYEDDGKCGGIKDPAEKDFTFACAPDEGGQGYTITATGASANGMGDFVYTIDENGLRQTTKLPEKWGTASTSSPVNCWVTKKGGGC